MCAVVKSPRRVYLFCHWGTKKAEKKTLFCFFSGSGAIFFDKFERKWSNCRTAYMLNHYQVFTCVCPEFRIGNFFSKLQQLLIICWLLNLSTFIILFWNRASLSIDRYDGSIIRYDGLIIATGGSIIATDWLIIATGGSIIATDGSIIATDWLIIAID